VTIVCVRECLLRQESNCADKTSNEFEKGLKLPNSSHVHFGGPIQALSATMLDNPVWHALSQRHAHFSEGGSRAKRYSPEITQLAATVDSSAESYFKLAEMLLSGQMAGLFLESPASSLPGCDIVRALPLNQMVWEGGHVVAANAGEVLDKKDALEMLALAELTKPGPFAIRTIEMGRYIGIRKSGKLVAMAGERLQMPGYTEVSAVCTHPEHRGHGYASDLVTAMAETIIQKGDIPFLHVAAENATAIRVYEKLGFRTRRIVHLAVVKRKSE
jgi:ribosomal protein S18 acetylase RimI-like enzyme